MVQPKIYARVGAEVMYLVERIKESSTTLNVPLLLTCGTGDQFTRTENFETWFVVSISDDKTLLKFSNSYHDLLHEQNKEMVFDEILTWIKPRLEGTQKANEMKDIALPPPTEENSDADSTTEPKIEIINIQDSAPQSLEFDKPRKSKDMTGTSPKSVTPPTAPKKVNPPAAPKPEQAIELKTVGVDTIKSDEEESD